MKINVRTYLALILAEVILFIPAGGYFAATFPRTPSNLTELTHELQKPCLTLFRISPSLHFTSNQINQMQELLQKQRSECVGAMKQTANKYKSEITNYERHLQKVTATISNAERHYLHCKIQNLRYEQAQAAVLGQHAIPIASEDEKAKPDLIKNWPSDLIKIKQEIASGAYLKRR